MSRSRSSARSSGAVNKGLPIIPVRIEDAAPSKALEYFISTPHWLGAFTPPLEEQLNQLAAAVTCCWEPCREGAPAPGKMGLLLRTADDSFASWHTGRRRLP